MLLKNKFFFADLQTLPNCIRLYGGLNISRLKFSQISEIFPLEMFRLYGKR